jgi:hypothetical protein
MSSLMEAAVTIALAIVGLGIVSVLVSRRAQTPAVIQASGSAFSNALAVAESPVTGAGYHVNLSYPGTDYGGSFGGMG